MRIMFVCTGNICRSAMAHALMEKKLKEIQKEDCKIYSCGIAAYDGDGSTYNAIEAMKPYGVDLKSHRATSLANASLEKMDVILCMTRSQKITLKQLYPNLTEKIYTFKEYVNYKQSPDDIDIMDPWGYNLTTYQNCAEEIDICTQMLLEKVKQND